MNLPACGQSSLWLPVGQVADSCGVVEFSVGPRSLPYLADHGFHDMVVLPGSFYIALIQRLHRELFQQDANHLRHIHFENPVLLTDEDVAITVRVEKLEHGRVGYELFEATGEVVRHSTAPQPCARLQVDADPSASSDATDFEPEKFVTRASSLGNAGDFYRRLRANGNQYGPAFQTLAGVWRSGSQAAGRFAASAAADLSPALLDAASQLLASLTLDHGRTFILKSIDRLVAGSPSASAPAWAHASRRDGEENDDATLVGSVEVVDSAGTRLWELSGVTLAFIDRPASEEETRLCVASTFTAEPLEDSLRFWGEQLRRKVRVDFAPYNQVFQQLLDPASAFRGNRDGVNLLVLALEDWLHEDRRTLDPAHAAACFGDRTRCVLPNGLEIVHLHRYETDYVYQEIFEDESYLRHGIRLADGDTVIDIGANIGLFSLFVLSRCKSPAIYAFEPSPRVFDLLQANLAAHGDPARVHAFHCGVAEKRGQARFTFYENSSVFSGFHPDEREDRAAVEAVVRNVVQNETPDLEEADIRDLTDRRLQAEAIECPLTSVSDIIRDHGLERIHLLKIDAEKSEAGILRGIDEEHWPRIEQIVVEVHDRTQSAVSAIEDQLTRRGYRCAVVEEKLLEHSGLFNLYATRRTPVATAGEDAASGLQERAGEFCTALDTFAAFTPAPLILAITPRAAAAGGALDAVEERILAHAARHPQIRSIGSSSIVAQYPVREWHDAHSHQLGHMPFTPEGYAAIGTALFRAFFQLGAPPVKVIALDCDNTLWQGQCGEGGPGGVQITEPFRRLQEFMIEQMNAGVLLALCSKNHEADALAVFERHAGMPLRREHLAGWQINWASKPENLRALAAQFNVGLESIVCIDDNPLECAAVRAACPEVLVLQLPQETQRIPTFLEHVWIFDRAAATREDRARSQWYRANAEREEERTAAPTLRDFLEGLQLRVEVTEATDDQLGRVAQLTVRTNQFNLAPIRRSEGDLRALLRSGATCLVASVSDRFGDYGLVGAILFTRGNDRFLVDTLLLSCRALGKGVEHRMVAELAGRALRERKTLIELPYRPTDRNEPARQFLASLGALADGEKTIELPAAVLAAVRYEPNDQTAPIASAPQPARKSHRANLSAAMQRLGDGFNTVEAIVAAMESSRTQPATGPEPIEDASALERSLAAIWKKALGRTRVGLNENFFDAGGTSLKAVVVVAMIRRELRKNVSIVALFECPTIQLLAAKLDGSPVCETASATAASAESRGRQRRNKLVKRRVA